MVGRTRDCLADHNGVLIFMEVIMSFFSKLFGNHERQLEDMYVKMYVSDKGMPLSEARQAIRGFIQQAKEEGVKEGTANLPPNFGDELLRQESSDEKIGAVLASIRKKGVTDEDIRWWWNMPDLDRRLMLKEDEANRLALFIHYWLFGE